MSAMRTRALGACVAIYLLAACGSSNPNCEGDSCVDAGPPDALLTCADPSGPQCDASQLCRNGVCVENTCATANPCTGSDACTLTCVPTVDRCANVQCPDEQTCVDGACVPGCFAPSACLNMDCADDEYCQFGACRPLVPCALDCGEGFTCHVTCIPPNPCDGVTCAGNEFCYQGQCIVNPCHNVQCAAGEVCNGGTCVATCNCGDCGPNGECVNNQCVCAPDCAGKACGDDDGCGGQCDVQCPEGGQYDCRPDNVGDFVCQCVGSCTGKACGADDGCGNECNGSCAMSGDACTQISAGDYECQCNPQCPNPAGQQCGSPNTCNTGYCDIEDCADSGETCNSTGSGMYACVCPAANQQCSGDCCPAPTDTCRTDAQPGTGTTGATTGPEACCPSSDSCTEPGRTNVCCTGNGLSCVDSNNNGQTDSCCTAARQCNDTTGAEVNQMCCASGEQCMDTSIDADTQREQCCPQAQICNEIGTCCSGGTYCATRPGGGNDMCCPTGTFNCDGACVAGCNGVAPNACNDGTAGNEFCCAANEILCDGRCEPRCASGQTQHLCNDGIPDNEECCASNVQRCPGAANNSGGTAACCILPEDECKTAAGEAPICCSDEQSFCNDSGACCPNPEICIGDADGNDNNDRCCTSGQVLDGTGQCCTPTCPDPSTIPCGTLDSCGYQECEGTCNAVSTCIDIPASGPDNYTCQPVTCDPICNTAACYDCVAGTCDFRCDNPGNIGTVCLGGQCVIP